MDRRHLMMAGIGAVCAGMRPAYSDEEEEAALHGRIVGIASADLNGRTPRIAAWRPLAIRTP